MLETPVPTPIEAPGLLVDPPDLMALLTIILAAITTQEVARAVGPYAAIFVASCGGAALKLSGLKTSPDTDNPLTRWEGCKYIAIRILLATVLTVTAANLLHQLAGWAKPQYTLVPIAFVLGYDYKVLFSWVGTLVDKWANRQVEK